MKVKLIQAGGFAGRHKTAEEELSNYTQSVQQKVISLFNQSLKPEKSKSSMRDKESLFLELNGKSIQLNKIKIDEEMKKLIEKLKAELQY